MEDNEGAINLFAQLYHYTTDANPIGGMTAQLKIINKVVMKVLSGNYNLNEAFVKPRVISNGVFRKHSKERNAAITYRVGIATPRSAWRMR